MENHVIQIFGGKKGVLMTLILVAVFALLGPALSLTVAVPQLVALLLLAFLLMLGHVGLACAVLCGLAMAAQCTLMYGAMGGLCAAILIMPLIVAAAMTVEMRKSFFVSVGICTGVAFLSVGAMLAVLTLSTGSDVVTMISGIVREGLGNLGEAVDPLLYMLAQGGIISLPEGVQLSEAAGTLLGQVPLADGSFLPSMLLGEQARGEMIESLAQSLDTVFRYQLPMMIASCSITVGLFGQALVRRGVNRRGELAPYPPMREWLVPSGFGRILGGTYVLLYVLMLTVGGRMAVLTYTFSGVFQEIFAIQGIAALCYVLHQHGKGRGLKALVFVLGYFLLRQAAVLVGIVDQSLDFTHRREALEGTGDGAA